MTNDTFDVAAAGHICFDIIPQFYDTGAKKIGEIMTPGKLVNMGPVATSTGGPVSNTGIGLHILGLKVTFMAKVGNDAFGKAIIERLENVASAEGIKVEEGGHTSYTVAIAPPGIDRIFLHHPGTNNTFISNDVNYDLVAKARNFHLGYPPLMKGLFSDEGKELVATFRKAKETGATTSLDMSLPDPNSESGKAPWNKIVPKLLPYVDIFLPSIEEAFFMMENDKFLKMKTEHGGAELIDFFDADDYTALSDQFLEFGSKIVALKSGHRGFYVRTADKSKFSDMGRAQPGDADNWSNRELWCPAFKVDPIASATGSGDSSIAGFLSAYLRGETVERSLKMANTAGSLNLTELDALSGLKNWDQTSKLADNKSRKINEFEVKTPGWSFDKNMLMWVKQ
ncbi:MAG: carbohydrate kinase family protein [Planctomycetota bacterium]|nr:MAG: carbohydrate kinase family protein [Planctomycetota bacterium]